MEAHGLGISLLIETRPWRKKPTGRSCEYYGEGKMGVIIGLLDSALRAAGTLPRFFR
jgi:hypothetical protein